MLGVSHEGAGGALGSACPTCGVMVLARIWTCALAEEGRWLRGPPELGGRFPRRRGPRSGGACILHGCLARKLFTCYTFRLVGS